METKSTDHAPWLARSWRIVAIAEVLSEPEPAPAAAESAPTAASSRLAEQRAMRILLAEDTADNRKLIQAYLKKSPCELDMAENGQMAVQMFTAGR
jgi:PleD family two-component response regulator